MTVFLLKGKVSPGKKLGRQLGFPTINIKVPDQVAKDLWGVYFSEVKVWDKIYPALTHLGQPKTFGELEPTCETHLLDWSGDLYGQTVEIKLIKKTRDIKKFLNTDELKKQLKQDTELARNYFNL